MKHDDFEIEPVRGLPEKLPRNEWIVWQGAPDWKALARRTFHVRKLAVYFVLLAVWRFAANFQGGEAWGTALGAAALMLLLGVVAIGLFCLFAWLTERTTVYTITNKRLVMRFGVTLPITFNLPYSAIKSASLKSYADGTGDIPVALVDGQRLAYFILWPHARPWRLAKPQPTLRSIPNAESVARQLSEHLAKSVGERAPVEAAGAQTQRDPSPAVTTGKRTAEVAPEPANAVA